MTANWTTTRDLFQPGERRGPKVDQRLGEAWVAIMEGRGSIADGQIALADLANESGYFFTAPVGVSNEELQQREGMRKTFARILFLVDVSDLPVGDLRRAALEELQTSNEEELR